VQQDHIHDWTQLPVGAVLKGPMASDTHENWVQQVHIHYLTQLPLAAVYKGPRDQIDMRIKGNSMHTLPLDIPTTETPCEWPAPKDNTDFQSL
jgi:hypothetical protein